MDPNETSRQETRKEKEPSWPVIFPRCCRRFATEIGSESCPEGSANYSDFTKQQLHKRKGKNFNFEFTSSETFLECVLNFPFCNRIICMYFWHKIHTKVLPKLRNATARFILDYRKRRCMYSHQLDCLMSNIWCTNACIGFCYNQQSNLCYVDDWYFGSFCIHCIWLRIRFPNIFKVFRI